MRQTFECRQELINNELTSVTLILEKFPRFVDFEDGFLVCLYFNFMLHMIQANYTVCSDYRRLPKSVSN